MQPIAAKEKDDSLEMEFDNGDPDQSIATDKKIEPPPLQDSKDYYNST